MDAQQFNLVASRRLKALAAHLTLPEASEGPLVSETGATDDDWTRSKINTATLTGERAKARFDVKQLAYVIDGGKDKTEVRRNRLVYAGAGEGTDFSRQCRRCCACFTSGPDANDHCGGFVVEVGGAATSRIVRERGNRF